MASPQRQLESPLGYRFGDYEADLRRCELRKFGIRVKLERKPWQLLAVLLERNGELVTRAELQTALWPEGTFVDFEHGLNSAVKKVRAALCDSTGSPRYILTFPGEGYRFIAPVQQVSGSAQTIPLTIPVPATSQGHGISFRSWMALLTLVVLLAVGVALWHYKQPSSQLHGKPWVLIARFDNRTGEPAFDDAVSYAVTRELSASRALNVVPDGRIFDALQLMKKPSGEPLIWSTARELALRDGGIDLVLTGRLDRFGNRFSLSISLIDPASEKVVFTGEQHIDAPADALRSVRQLTDDLRKDLGETNLELINRPQLAKATTASLQALQSFSRGLYLYDAENVPASRPFFEEAVRLDPDFALAHLFLALSLSHQGAIVPGPASDRELLLLTRAYQLSSHASVRERYLIHAHYRWYVTGEHQAAIDDALLLVQQYPNDYLGVSILFRFLRDEARRADGLPYAWKLTELRPHDLGGLFQLLGFVRWRDPVLYDRLERKAFQMASSEYASQTRPREWAWMQFHDVDQSLQRGEYTAALQQLRKLTDTIELRPEPARSQLRMDAAEYFVALGRLADAEAIMQRATQVRLRYQLQTQVARLRGDRAAVRSLLRLRLKTPEIGRYLILDLAEAGMSREGRTMFRQHMHTEGLPDQHFFRGELLLGEGDSRHAISELQTAFDMYYRDFSIAAAYVADPLARAYQREGNFDAAAALLEKSLAIPLIGDETLYYTLFHAQLITIYRHQGTLAAAERHTADLRRMLSVADPDHPLLRLASGKSN